MGVSIVTLVKISKSRVQYYHITASRVPGRSSIGILEITLFQPNRPVHWYASTVFIALECWSLSGVSENPEGGSWIFRKEIPCWRGSLHTHGTRRSVLPTIYQHVTSFVCCKGRVVNWSQLKDIWPPQQPQCFQIPRLVGSPQHLLYMILCWFHLSYM